MKPIDFVRIHKEKFLDAINPVFSRNAILPTDNVATHLESPLNWIAQCCHSILAAQNLFFIGNGASASMASHFASDFTKNANMPAESLNDGAMMTCFANDYSYEDAYMEMLKRKFCVGDVLVCISSSGNSKNIVKAAEYIMSRRGKVISFSGFNPDNKLRHVSESNCWVNSNDYGIVESTHAYYLHLLIDYYCEFFNKKI